MAIQAGAYATISPNFTEPELLLQYTQPSGFVDLLADKQIRVRLAEDDLIVYMKQLNLRTQMAAGTASMNELPGVNISTQMLSTPTYLFKVRSTFDHHDIAAASRWGFPAVEAYRLGMRQGNFQLARDACLYGMHPENGEGITNAPGAFAINLPPDPNGNTTSLSYDNGAMAFFLLQQIQQLKTRTLQMGIGREFTIIGPQRTLGQFEYNVVQLLQFQREGAGTTSTAGTLKEVLMQNGDKLIWSYDDTLIGKGAGSTASNPVDLVILIMPEVAKPAVGSQNTNIFASLAPGSSVCTTQYADMPAPREIMSPMAGGATDFMQEWRLTSGWSPRPQGTVLVSMPY